MNVKETNYSMVTKQLSSLIEGETNLIAILSNTSALLNDALDQVNWVGFYLIEGNGLILGPFQGHPACTLQLVKAYVALQFLKIQHNVSDVHQFQDTLHVMQIVNQKLSFRYVLIMK